MFINSHSYLMTTATKADSLKAPHLHGKIQKFIRPTCEELCICSPLVVSNAQEVVKTRSGLCDKLCSYQFCSFQKIGAKT
jgi:hypothetical protein